MVILTDLSGVLINGIQGSEIILAKKFGKKAGELFWERHIATYNDFENLMRGNMTEKEYWDIFFKDQNFPFNYNDVDKAFSSNLRKKIPGTLEMYNRIISHPHHIGYVSSTTKGRPSFYLVSDHIRERVNYISKYHKEEMFYFFAKKFWSFKTGKLKRDPGFFRDLLSETKLRPERVVFIDDNQINVNMAALSGIPSILFESPDQVEHVLKYRYGFDFLPKIP